MIISGEQDIQGLRDIGRIIALTLQELQSHLQPGITTGELDAVCARELQAHGATPAPMIAYGFPGQLCISVNEEVVHGIPGSRVIEAGDLVKLDLEAEKNGYIADATIAVVVPPVSDLARQLIDCAEAAFFNALPAVRAGKQIREIGKLVEQTVKRCSFIVVRQLCGHGVGRQVHEKPNIPNFPDPSARQQLTEGMVITIEPIISARIAPMRKLGDGWTIRNLDGTLACHYEHTLIVTKGEPLIVTKL